MTARIFPKADIKLNDLECLEQTFALLREISPDVQLCQLTQMT